MATMETPTKTKYVFSASAVPDEVAQAAQVVIVGEFTWHVIAPAPHRMHCLLSFAPVPAVTCPVVNVAGVKNDEGMAEIVRTCTDPTAGVINMEGLLTGLEALGAKVSKAVKSDQSPVNSDQLAVKKKTARELSTARMEQKERRPARRVRVH